MDDIRLGFAVLGNLPSEMVELAVLGESLGFHRVWFGDHLAQPSTMQESQYPYAKQALTLQTVDYIDPLVEAAAIAAATTRIEIATGIYLLPLHHPVVVARALSTLNNISHGRFILGVGAGWMQEEFDVVGVDFASRGKRLDEALEVLRTAKRGGAFEFHGAHFDFAELTVSYRPAPVPLVIGGISGLALKRAARLGDGWYSTPNQTLEEVLTCRDVIEAHRATVGRSGETFTYYVRLPHVDPDLVEPYRKAGFTDFTLGSDELFPRARVASMSLDEKRAVLEEQARNFGLAPIV